MPMLLNTIEINLMAFINHLYKPPSILSARISTSESMMIVVLSLFWANVLCTEYLLMRVNARRSNMMDLHLDKESYLHVRAFKYANPDSMLYVIDMGRSSKRIFALRIANYGLEVCRDFRPESMIISSRLDGFEIVSFELETRKMFPTVRNGPKMLVHESAIRYMRSIIPDFLTETEDGMWVFPYELLKRIDDIRRSYYPALEGSLRRVIGFLVHDSKIDGHLDELVDIELALWLPGESLVERYNSVTDAMLSIGLNREIIRIIMAYLDWWDVILWIIFSEISKDKLAHPYRYREFAHPLDRSEQYLEDSRILESSKDLPNVKATRCGQHCLIL